MIKTFLKEQTKKIMNILSRRKTYNVLIWGNSLFEYAMARELRESNKIKELYIANAEENQAISKFGTLLKYNNNKELISEAKKHKVDIFISNSEVNIQGIIDEFNRNKIKTFGVNQKWTSLEASKIVGKRFAEKYNIPHPRYRIIKTMDDFDEYIGEFSFPVVIKANGYSKGSGVFICKDIEEAKKRANDILDLKIVTTMPKLIIEEHIKGQECTFMAVWDGKHLLKLPPVKDYKRMTEDEFDLNTGGMASYCPLKLTVEQSHLIDDYLDKLEKILKAEKADFKGVIYSGMIFSEDKLHLLEFNMRFGSPETIALMLNMKTNLFEIIESAVNQKLNTINIEMEEGAGFVLCFVCPDYPQGHSETVELDLQIFDQLENNGILTFIDSGKIEGSKYLKKGDYIFAAGVNSVDPIANIYSEVEKIKINSTKYKKM